MIPVVLKNKQQKGIETAANKTYYDWLIPTGSSLIGIYI